MFKNRLLVVSLIVALPVAWLSLGVFGASRPIQFGPVDWRSYKRAGIRCVMLDNVLSRRGEWIGLDDIELFSYFGSPDSSTDDKMNRGLGIDMNEAQQKFADHQFIDYPLTLSRFNVLDRAIASIRGVVPGSVLRVTFASNRKVESIEVVQPR